MLLDFFNYLKIYIDYLDLFEKLKPTLKTTLR
jgi:hypothetical protein